MVVTVIQLSSLAALAQEEDESGFSFYFDRHVLEWMVGFTDMPADYDQATYECWRKYRSLSDRLECSGIYVQEQNLLRDLSIIQMRGGDGLRPNAACACSVSNDNPSNVSAGLLGLGCSHGESVLVRAGASTLENLAKQGG